MATKRMTWMAAVLGTVALSGMMSCNGKGGKEAGAAAVSVGGQALTLSDVKSVTVTVTGGITNPLTVPLVGNSSVPSTQYSALISDLPIGCDYVFTASAYAADGTTVLYQGAASAQCITKNQTANIIIDMTDKTTPVTVNDDAPFVNSITDTAGCVSVGDTVTIKATAHDLDPGDTAGMTWAWSVPSCGTLSAPVNTVGTDTTPGTSTVVFTAVTNNANCQVNLVVKDARMASTLQTTAVVAIAIGDSCAYGNAKITAIPDTCPAITGLASSMSPLVNGQTATLTVTASDSDGDALNYNWTSDCTGSVGHFLVGGAASTTATGNPVQFVYTAGDGSYCNFYVTVDDGTWASGNLQGQTKCSVVSDLSVPGTGSGYQQQNAGCQWGYDYMSENSVGDGDVVTLEINAPCASPVWSDGTPIPSPSAPFTTGVTYTTPTGSVTNGASVTVTCGTGYTACSHTFAMIGKAAYCAQPGVAVGADCTSSAQLTDKCVQAAACNSAGQCVATSQVPCTGAAPQCQLNQCDPTTGQCGFVHAPNGSTCSDGLACTTGDTCNGGVCQPTGAVTCSQTGVAQCKVNACVEPSGSCVVGNQPDGTVCDDSNGCTGASDGTIDTCTTGTCGGPAVVCSPSNYVCTSLTDTTHVCAAAVCMSPSWDRSTNTTAPVVGLSVGPDGNPWVVGTLFATFPLNLGSGVVSSSGGADIYVAQLDATGTATQTLTFGDPGANDQIPAGLAVSKSGTVGLIGVYTSEIDFTSGCDTCGGNGNLGSDYLATSTAGTGFYVSLLATPVAHNVVLNNGALAAIASNPALDGFVICGQADVAVAASTNKNGLLKGHTSSWVTGNGMDVVVAKIAADGSVLWGTQIGGVGDQVCQSVAMDSNGDVLIAGNYGNGTPSSFFTTTSPAPAAGAAYIYVAKLAGATGNVIAAQGWGTSGRSSVNAITAIDTSNILIAGSISGPITFNGSVNLAYLGLTDAYVAKLNVSGTAISAVWANAYGDADHDQSANGVAVGSNGYVYVGGTYSGSLGALGLSSASATSPDGFTAELTSDGQTVKCAQTYGDAAGTQGVLTLSISPANKVYIAGSYSNSIQFSPLAALTTPGAGTAYGFIAGLGTP